MEKKIQKKEKAFSSINTKSFIMVVIILTIMIAISGILSLIIP